MISNDLIVGFENLVSGTGRIIRIDLFDVTIGSVYDNTSSQTLSSTSFVSGIVMPLNNNEGSEDSILLEQGKLIDGDKTLFLGDIQLAGINQNVEFHLGSPTGDIYGIVPNGAVIHEVNGVTVYKKQFIRKLNN